MAHLTFQCAEIAMIAHAFVKAWRRGASVVSFSFSFLPAREPSNPFFQETTLMGESIDWYYHRKG